MSALADRFRLAREARGLSLSDVAEKIHIRSIYLDAIERGDWNAVGAPVYARGFIRTYARFLNIDPEDAIAAFAAEAGTSAPVGPVPSSGLSSEAAPTTSPVVAIAGAVAIALVAYAAYTIFEWQHPAGAPQAQATAVASPSQAPSPPSSVAAIITAAPTLAASPSREASATANASPTAQSSPSPGPSATPASGRATVALRFSDRSWVRVTVDGVTAMQGIFPSGTGRTFSGKSVTVRVGNAAGVDLSLNGKSIGSLGGDGDVAERTFKAE